ncbi:MAG: right-handed parallel beta-helix repeat-containing protein, partial [Bacteroidales bacterium]|nr:right-handed parallel beta-helix repeat-containing protein [Bacteroidales bacterium]
MKKLFTITSSIRTGAKRTILRDATLICALIATISLHGQVQFTQTSDDDFNLGITEQMLVTGGSVRLQTQATAVNNWLSTTALPQPLKGHQTTRWKNLVYLSGGYNGTTYSNSVYRAAVQSAGISGWTALDTMPERLCDHAMVRALRHMYVIGGRTDGTPSDRIYVATINTDGSLGAWSLCSVTLPVPLWGHQAVYRNGFIYIIGGTDQADENTAVNIVYYARVTDPFGQLSAFTATQPLPAPRNRHSLATYGDRLIVMGGVDNSGTRHAEVYYAELNLDGTCDPWQLAPASLPEAISHHSTACINGLITVIGGENNTSVSNKVYYATADDLPGLTWVTAADSLYERRKEGTAFAISGQIVFAGGENLAGAVIANTRYSQLTMGTGRTYLGSFLSYPFFQLGEERMVEKLDYTMANFAGGDHYRLYYRLAGSDGLWGPWTDAGQYNPALISQTAQYLQYMFTFDGSLGETIELQSLTLVIPGYTQLSGNLNAIDTLHLSQSPYWATANISFTGGTHVVEAGVTILFSPSTGLEIGQANLTCNGAAAQPVTLTSYTGEAGIWDGVFFNANSDNGVSSQLNHLIIEYAGNGSRNANLYCENTNEPHLINSTLRWSDGHGAYLKNANLSIENSSFMENHENGLALESSSPSLTGCYIQNNDIAGIRYVNTSANPSFLNCTLTGNKYGLHFPTPDYSFSWPGGITTYSNLVSGIAIDGGEVTSDRTWYLSPDGYTVLGDVAVVKQNAYVTLTIRPGNLIRFDSTVQLQIGNYVYFNNQYGGAIHAVGTADSIITFTSSNGQPGGWDGIFFHYNSDIFGAHSELTYCKIENGADYNIKCEDSVEPRIDECDITGGQVYQIFAANPNSVPHVTKTNSTVTVGAGTQSINRTWYNFGGEYHVVGDIIIAKQDNKVTLTIQPGVTVRFATGTGIQIGQYIYYNQNYGGELYAIGNADSLITFTSLTGTKATWDGLFFHYNSDSFGSQSYLEYCTITNGETSNVLTDATIEPRIDHCTILNAGQYDILANDPNSVPHITRSVSTVYVNGGTQSINRRWYYFGGDYVVLTDLVVAKQNDKVRLTIEPGNTVKADTNAMIQIGQYIYYNQNYGGEIWAIGKPDSLITFTSRNGQAGGWDGLYFHYNSDSFTSESFLEYCTVEKGKDFNVRCSDSREPTITNCTINGSNGYDIHAANPNSVPEVFATNSTIYISAGTQGIDITWHNFGGEYVVVGDVVVAKQNSHCRLTIEPGVVVNFDTACVLQIGQYIYFNQNYGGEIYAEGTYDSLIVFRPWNNYPGGWEGIFFHDYSDSFGSVSSLKYCVIREAEVNNVYCHTSNQPSFEHVSLVSSSENGIRCHDASPYIRLCQIIDNDSLGVYLTGNSHPVIGDTAAFGCDLYGNGNYDIYNNTGNHIYARNNYWNSTDSAAIAGRIFDHYDQGSLGIVEFMPFATSSAFANDAPGNFSLLTPPDYTVTSDQTPDFTWAVSIDPNGDPVTYYHFYTTDSTWSNDIHVSSALTTHSYTPSTNLTGGKWYWWKVKATDGYLLNFSNQIWRFAVSLPPTVPVPIDPFNGAHVTENDYLVWLLSSDPDEGDRVSHYHLQIDDNADFSSPEIDTTGIASDGDPSAYAIRINELPGYLSLANRLYYWRVSAVDGFGVESAFSDGTNYFIYLLDVNIR